MAGTSLLLFVLKLKASSRNASGRAHNEQAIQLTYTEDIRPVLFVTEQSLMPDSSEGQVTATYV